MIRNSCLSAGAVFVILIAAVIGTTQPAVTQASQTVRKIGFLSVYGSSEPASKRWHLTFRRSLGSRGWVLGENISIDYRWIGDTLACKSAGRRACVPALVDELLGLGVELIVVHGGFPARAIQKRNKMIPVVMAEASDAVGRGIVASLARPDGNITGLTSITPELAAKRLEMLKEIVPDLKRIAVLWTPNAPASTYAWKQIKDIVRHMGLRVHSLEVRRSSDPKAAFDKAVKAGAQALVSTSGVSSTFTQKRIAALAVRSRLPSVFINEDEARLGGLISYNRDTEDLYRRAAHYVDKILKGAKPADLPIEQPSKFSLIVNLKTAKALNLTIPPSILMRADEVIE